MNKKFIHKLIFIFLFSVAFAFVESSVVIYLRAIYYPQGFHFPIKRHYDLLMVIEVIREFSTLVIMISLSVLLSKKFWEGFGYFLIIFGLWDILFYLWLKVAINWPESFFTPDILFLIPIPWIAPVLAPVIVSLVMILIGYDIVKLFEKGYDVRPGLFHWAMVLAGSTFILYSFVSDIDAGFHEKYPLPYNWILFFIGIASFVLAHIHLHKITLKKNNKLSTKPK
jgi:hypothetical protein